MKASSHGSPVGQVPVDDLLGGIFDWLHLYPGKGGSRGGGIIVIGKDAKPIPGRAYAPGTESWFLSPPPLEGFGGDNPPIHQLSLRLVSTAPTEDAMWTGVAAQTEASTEFVASTPIAPAWVSAGDLPIPSTAVVFTLKAVMVPNGTANGAPIEELSVILNFDPIPAALPTWYRQSSKTAPLWGDTPIVDGITARFEQVSPDQPGYPQKGWEGSGPIPRG